MISWMRSVEYYKVFSIKSIKSGSIKKDADFKVELYFTPGSKYYFHSESANRFFLKRCEDVLNLRLIKTKKMTLNEVLDFLDMEKLLDGDLYGWNFENDDQIDFSLDRKLTNFYMDPDRIPLRFNCRKL